MSRQVQSNISPTQLPQFHSLSCSWQILIQVNTLESWLKLETYVQNWRILRKEKRDHGAIVRQSCESTFNKGLASYQFEELLLSQWSGSDLNWLRIDWLRDAHRERQNLLREMRTWTRESDEMWESKDALLDWV